MGYKKSENPIYPAVGTIMQYYGTTDPPGWLLCDGVIRTSTDSRYSNLAILLGGSNTANSLRPPDLRTRMLHGTTSSMPINNVGGSTTFSLLETHLPQHGHTGTLSTNGNHTHNNIYSWYGNNNVMHHTQSDRMSSGFHGDAGHNSSSGTAIGGGGSHGHTLSLDNGPGRGFPVNILPSCYKVNHIIKY
jgi:microcystin-dependent protein